MTRASLHPGDLSGTSRPDAELDRKLLLQIRKRFLQLNRERLDRLRVSARDRERELIDLLPLLFHVNHPLLPGWLDMDVPCSLSDYTPSQTALLAARRIARGYHYEKRASLKRDLHAVYLMGSTGTLGHSGDSDLDVWLIHRDDLSADGVAQLREKANRITQFASREAVQLHVFPMTAAAVRQGDFGPLSTEHSGSTQHALLLDEFYRSALLLGGRLPLWWQVPPEHHHHYSSFAHRLIEQRYIKASDVVDFGNVDQIPAIEFFTGALWQLNKAIDSPYKSVLKLALMESYAQQPAPPPLSLQFKQKVYQNRLSHDDIDPYLLVYQAVEDHLLRLGRLDRLDLIRRSFYLKTGERLSQPLSHPDWRRPLLMQRVQSWGWNKARLQELDQRRQWKLERVQEERKQLVQELVASFRALSAIARQESELARSRQDELTVLGRKLFAMLEKRAGKIERLDIGIAPDLQEPALTVRADSPYQFALLRGRHDSSSAETAVVLKRSHHVLELLAWAQVNGLLTRRTRLALVAGDSGLRLIEIDSLARALLELLPQPLPPPDDDDLRQPAELRRAAIIVNLGIDPMAERTRLGLQLVSSQTDALAYGALREQLVQQIDLISLNSWGEAQIQSFSDNDALPQLLLNLHQQIGQQPLTPLLNVHCFCVHRADSISRRVTDVVDEFCGPIRRAAQSAPLRYVLRLGQGYRQFRLDGGQIDVISCADFSGLLAELAEPLPPACELRFEAQAITEVPLHLIYGQRRQGAVQIFFRAETDRIDVYLLDEADALAVAQQPLSSVELLLKPWYLFLTSVAERLQSLKGLPPLPEPELFELMPARHGEPAWLRRHPLPEALHQQAFFAVAASARLEQRELRDLELQCAGKEYSELQQGTDFLGKVAHDILHQRRTLGRYPIYVTDLTLAPLPETASTALLVHYKLQLEEQLNRAAGLLG